jgi:hypothetical protein
MSVQYTEQPTPDDRAQLDALKARYDSQKVPAAIFEVIRDLEIEIAWQQHIRGST